MHSTNRAMAGEASEDEKALLGSMLLDPSGVGNVLKTVSLTDFGDYAYRAVYEAIANRYREAKGDAEALVVMVQKDLEGHPRIDDRHLLMAEIYESVATAAHAPTYAKVVRDASQRRQLRSLASQVSGAVETDQDTSTILNDLHADCQALLRSEGAARGIKKFELGDLITKNATLDPPVIDGLIREGETANLVAASKVGKSWMVYGLAISIASNQAWLGRFDVSQGKVLIIDNELKPNTLARRLQTVADAMGVPVSMIANDIDVWALRGDLRTLQELGREFDRFEPGEYKAIILDAKYRFAAPGVSENDNAAETLFYNTIDQYASSTGAAFVLIHHAAKGDQSSKAVTDVGAGAGAQSRAVDCHMVLRSHEEPDCAVLDAAARSFAPIEPVTLRWAYPVWIDDRQLDPAKLKGRDGKAAQKRADDDRAGMAAIVESLGVEELSNRQLRKQTGMSRERVGRLLDMLESQGRVASKTVEKRGNQCEIFSLTGDVDGQNGRGRSTTRPRGSGTEAVCVRPPKGEPPTSPASGPGRDGVDTWEEGNSRPRPFPEFDGHDTGTIPAGSDATYSDDLDPNAGGAA